MSANFVNNSNIPFFGDKPENDNFSNDANNQMIGIITDFDDCEESLDTKEHIEGTNMESSYVIYENLTERLRETPIKFSKTDLTYKQYKKFCQALLNIRMDSILLLGDEGSGKSSLVYNFIQENFENSISECLKDVQIISFSALGFPEKASEIVVELIKILNQLYIEGYKKIILYFDDFTRYPTCFWHEFPAIVDGIISEAENEGFEYLKIIVSISSSEYYVIGEDLKCDVVRYSLMFNYRQETLFEKILKTLEPRIKEARKVHGVSSIDKNVYELIYTLCLADVDYVSASYKSFLATLEKILSWCEIENISKLTLKKAIKYYYDLGEDIECDMFPVVYNISEVARHEAGHTLLALLLSDFIYISGVTILKFQNLQGSFADGVTVAKTDDRTWWMNKERYTKYLAFFLAGKYAESGEDAGSCEDLNDAYYSAKHFVCTSGLFPSLGNNFYCEEKNYNTLSETQKKLIEEDTKALLDEATDYAKKVIAANQDFIEELTDMLLKKKFVGREDLLQLWKTYGVIDD